MIKLLQTKDTLLKIIFCIFFGIIEQSTFRILPMIVITRSDFSYSFLNGLLMGVAYTNIFLVAFLIFWKLSGREVYYTVVTSFLSKITTLLLFLLYNQIGNNVTLRYMMLVVTLLCNVVYFLADHTFSVITSAKLAHSCNQGVLECVRLFSFQSGHVIDSVCVGVYYSYMNVFYHVLTTLSVVLFTLLILRRKTLSNPLPIV